MSTTADASPPQRAAHWRDPWRALVPIILLLAGALLRYAAYASVSVHPSPQGFVDAMCVWDCTWYGDIVLHGYQAHPENLNFGGPGGIANWAFFPLYPLLIAALQKAIGASPAMLGAIVSPLLTFAAAVVSWPLFAGNRRAYFLFAALLLAGPFSFYFSILYSESLFLLLTVVGFVLLGRRRYVAAGIVGGLLAATRTVGVLFVFALLAEAVMELWGQPLRQWLRRPDIVLGVLLVPLGLFAFMGWLYFVTGDALAFVHIQRGWDREVVNPLLGIWAALTGPDGTVRDAPLLGIASLAGLALCGALVWRRAFPAAAFTTLSLLLALTNGVLSMLRFAAALAPLGIVLCLLLARWRWLFWLSIVVFAVLDFAWTIGWIHQRGALM